MIEAVSENIKILKYQLNYSRAEAVIFSICMDVKELSTKPVFKRRKMARQAIITTQTGLNFSN